MDLLWLDAEESQLKYISTGFPAMLFAIQPLRHVNQLRKRNEFAHAVLLILSSCREINCVCDRADSICFVQCTAVSYMTEGFNWPEARGFDSLLTAGSGGSNDRPSLNVLLAKHIAGGSSPVDTHPFKNIHVVHPFE